MKMGKFSPETQARVDDFMKALLELISIVFDLVAFLAAAGSLIYYTAYKEDWEKATFWLIVCAYLSIYKKLVAIRDYTERIATATLYHATHMHCKPGEKCLRAPFSEEYVANPVEVKPL